MSARTQKAIIFLIVLFVCFWRYEIQTSLGTRVDYWFSKWSVMLFVCAGVIALSVYKTSKIAGLWILWTMISGLGVFSWRDTIYADLPMYIRTAFEADAAYAMVSLLLMMLVFRSISKMAINTLLLSFGYAGLISSCLVIIHCLRGKMYSLSTGGFFDQGSMEGVFIAVTYPMLAARPLDFGKNPIWRRLEIYFSLLIPVIAVVVLAWKAEASQPIVLMAIGFAITAGVLFQTTVFLSLLRIPKVPLIGALLFFSLSLAVVVGKTVNHRFFDNNARFPVYEMAINFLIAQEVRLPLPLPDAPNNVLYWTDTNFWIFGLGSGTYPVWGRWLQDVFKINEGSNFIFMHSDWLQLFFEQGIIGLILALGTGVVAIKRAMKSPEYSYLAASLIVYGAAMVFQFPWHLPVHSFLGLFILTVCLCSSPS